MAFQSTEISNALTEISKFSTDDLKELCNATTNDRFDQLVDQTDKVKSLEAEREMLMASVRSLAEFNLARQGDYESDRSRLMALVTDSNRSKENIQAKATKLLELSNKTSIVSTLSVVMAATAKCEEESEILASDFLDSKLDYDTFVCSYSEKRKLTHLRRIKADRLRQETNESWSGSRNHSFKSM